MSKYRSGVAGSKPVGAGKPVRLAVSVVLPLLVTVEKVSDAAESVLNAWRITWTSDPTLVFPMVGASDSAIVSDTDTITEGSTAAASVTVTLSPIEICAGGSTATASETPTISETVMTAAGKTAGWSLTATVSVTATTTAEGCTVSVTAAAVLPSKSRSPAYCAVIVCVPVESTTSTVASVVVPSLNRTEPVGVPLAAVTAAASVTTWPNTAGFADAASVVLVACVATRTMPQLGALSAVALLLMFV